MGNPHQSGAVSALRHCRRWRWSWRVFFGTWIRFQLGVLLTVTMIVIFAEAIYR